MAEENDLPRMDAAIGLMAPIISHEIRNPLATIGNSAYFIKTKLGKQGELDPKVRRHFEIIETELKHADNTLGEILSYARMPAPALAPQRLNALVEETLTPLDIPAGVALEKVLAAESPAVRVDADLLRNALFHVLRNALEALKGKGTLRVCTSRRGAAALMEISDTGPGVPQDARKKFFSPFNTTKPRGIGLGLAYAQKVLSLHKGALEFIESDSGAAFRLSVPLQPGG